MANIYISNVHRPASGYGLAIVLNYSYKCSYFRIIFPHILRYYLRVSNLGNVERTSRSPSSCMLLFVRIMDSILGTLSSKCSPIRLEIDKQGIIIRNEPVLNQEP